MNSFAALLSKRFLVKCRDSTQLCRYHFYILAFNLSFFSIFKFIILIISVIELNK